MLTCDMCVSPLRCAADPSTHYYLNNLKVDGLSWVGQRGPDSQGTAAAWFLSGYSEFQEQFHCNAAITIALAISLGFVIVTVMNKYWNKAAAAWRKDS